MEKGALSLSIFALISCLTFVSFAYETMEVTNGGSIEGVAVFAGTNIPKDETITLTTDIEQCGKYLPAGKYLISAEGMVKNVVVYLEDIKAGRVIPKETVTLTNIGCSFQPHVSVGFKGNKFIMKNDDPVLHTFDIHASISGKELYHVGLHEKGSSLTKTFTKTGLMDVTCYIHPWQHAYVHIFDHPYAAVTNEKGEFVIKDIPPGMYTVGAWHESLGRLRMKNVKINGGETSRIELGYN